MTLPEISGVDGGVVATARPIARNGDIDVFLSYSHEAKDSVAEPLVRGLKQRGVTVWWDHTAMRISDNLQQEIGKGIDRTRRGVAIVSHGYLDGGWGKTELGAMFGKKTTIFPILYGASVEDAQKSLPPISGTLVQAWGDSPESSMGEIAAAVSGNRRGQAGRVSASAPAARGTPDRAHSARGEGEPIPDGSEHKGSAPRVDWDLLKPGADVRKSFEDLCCFLAEREPAPDGSVFERLAPPDGGVECLQRLPDGQERGWQAKYFRAAPNSSQWKQIDKSVRRALESSPRLTRYTVCTPTDRTKAGAEKWSRLVEQWRAIKPIAYEYWGRHELESRLIDGKNRGLLKYYFDKEFLSAEWVDQTVSGAIADAGPRYTPNQNINLPVGQRFQALCGTEEFFTRLDSIAASLRDHLLAASTRPALDAADSEFAKLDSMIDGIASLLTAHATHRKDGIPAVQIKEKSHKAKAIIPSIDSKLADEGQKSGSRGAGQHYAGGIFDTERHRLQWLYDDLDELTDGQLSDDMDIHKTKALLVVGDAGVGKTHLFCDIAKGSIGRREMAILLHGSHFYGGHPKDAIIKNLDLDCRFSELLEALNLAGQVAGSRSLLMIDALNEGEGKDTWKRHIRGLLREVSSFPHVALALSVRTAYESEVIPGDVEPPVLRRIEHPGFEGRAEAALAMFFDNNRIERPAVPVMAQEFSNPQFLTVLCRGLKNKGYTRMPAGVDGIAAVYDLFIDSVNDKLADGGELGISKHHRIAHRAVDALAGRLIEGNAESLEYTEAHRLLSELDPTLRNLDRLLDALISEGVLGAYSPGMHAGTSTRRIRFAYERMSDNLIIKSLLDMAATAGEAAAMLRKKGPLAAYTANPLRHRGLVDALSVQLPERFNTELLEAAPDAPRKQLTESFLDSLPWRSPRSIGGTAVRLVDELLTGRQFTDHVLRALLAHSANPGSPLNADYLHRRLLGLEMADRDSCLAVFLHTDYTHEQHSIVDRLVGWARKEDRKFSDKTVRLAGLALGWFLTASNRFVRDRATKALVAMFTGREGLLVDVMSEFRDCGDPYVAERLFCAAYGCAMRGRSDEGLEKLAAYAYDAVFKQRSPPPDIMLRDYARGIILLAEHRGIDLGIDPRACSPPHNSDWIAGFPSKDDIKKIEKSTQGASGWNEAVSSIFASLDRMGDFYRYVIGEGSYGLPWINVRLPRDKTTWKEALASFDESVAPAQRRLWEQLLSVPSSQSRGTMPSRLVHDLEAQLSPEQADAFGRAILPCLRYSLDPSLEQYGFDTMQFARWIAGRVFELGWSTDRFGRHDASLESGPLPQSGAERVGKKYQWIAYHELLARLCDNFEFTDPCGIGRASIYESTRQLQMARDIDPSMPYFATAAEERHPDPCDDGGLHGTAYAGWGAILDDAEWLKDMSDLPRLDEMLTVTDGSGAKWLALYMSYDAEQQPIRRRAPRLYPYRRVELWAKSAIVLKKDAPALGRLGRGIFDTLRFPDAESQYGTFLGELYWADGLQDGRGGAAPPDAAIDLGNHDDRVKAYRTTYEYSAERGSQDFSLKNAITILAPSTFLAKGMGLSSMCDGTFADADGACVACNVDQGDAGSHMLLFRQEPLSEFLKSSGCELFWRTAACKHVVRSSSVAARSKPNRIAANSVYRMRDGGRLECAWSETDEE